MGKLIPMKYLLVDRIAATSGTILIQVPAFITHT